MTEPDAASLTGFTVAITASRRVDEFTTMLRRRGADVVAAAAMNMVPLADDVRLRAATEDVIDAPPDVLIATTGIGFRGWVEAAEGWGMAEALLAASGQGPGDLAGTQSHRRSAGGRSARRVVTGLGVLGRGARPPDR